MISFHPRFLRRFSFFSSLLSIIALVSLGGCKGGVLGFPGTANESLSGPSLYSVSGIAMDGPISGGSVAVAQYQSNGSLIPLGTVTTGRDGSFQITSLFDLSGGPVSFTLTGGSNIDISSGATVTTPTGVSLTSLIPASDLTHTTVVLTPFSSLEATEAQALMTNQGISMDQALSKATLCTGDPQCADHRPGEPADSLHGAACYSCLFLPETSCERGNRYLDRAAVVSTLTLSGLAFGWT